MENNEELHDLVHGEAKKAGIPSKQANKALNMLKKGKISMGSIAPQLKDMLSSNLGGFDTSTPREKLRAKLRSKREQRTKKVTRESNYEKSKQKMETDQKQRAEEKKQKAKREKARQRRHRQKLNELEEKLGTITPQLYRECMLRIQENNYIDLGSENHDKNIAELYHIQHQFTTKIESNTLDDLLSDDDDDNMYERENEK